MPLKILFVLNNEDLPVQDDIKNFIDWLQRKTPLRVEPSYLSTNLQTYHKDFGVKLLNSDRTAWGLDGIKEKLRPLIGYEYNIIIFVYQPLSWDFSARDLGAWTYPKNLQGAAFCEIPYIPNSSEKNQTYRLLTH